MGLRPERVKPAPYRAEGNGTEVAAVERLRDLGAYDPEHPGRDGIPPGSHVRKRPAERIESAGGGVWEEPSLQAKSGLREVYRVAGYRQDSLHDSLGAVVAEDPWRKVPARARELGNAAGKAELDRVAPLQDSGEWLRGVKSARHAFGDDPSDTGGDAQDRECAGRAGGDLGGSGSGCEAPHLRVVVESAERGARKAPQRTWCSG